MKYYLILSFIGLLACLTSCEAGMSKEDKTNRDYAQKLTKRYDKHLIKLIKERSREKLSGEAYKLYNELKKDKNFLGMSISGWSGSFCTMNAYNCSFDGELDGLLEDTTLKKTIWYGDLAYTIPEFNGDTLIPVRSATAGTGSQAAFERVLQNILVITYGEYPSEVRLFFKAKAILPVKQAEGASSWGGTGMIDPVFLDR